MATFADQVAIITGGAQGIGFAVAECVSARACTSRRCRALPLHAPPLPPARHLGAQGARICIVDMVAEKNASSVAALEAKGIRAMSEVVNVADEEQWKAAVAKFEAAFGRIDVLVQCAGITGKTGACRVWRRGRRPSRTRAPVTASLPRRHQDARGGRVQL